MRAGNDNQPYEQICIGLWELMGHIETVEMPKNVVDSTSVTAITGDDEHTPFEEDKLRICLLILILQKIYSRIVHVTIIIRKS